MKAFPSPHNPLTGMIDAGMDLRDYFAAKAMQSLLLSNEETNTMQNIVEAAYMMADAMLEQRSK
jgi:hypothetical protein